MTNQTQRKGSKLTAILLAGALGTAGILSGCSNEREVKNLPYQGHTSEGADVGSYTLVFDSKPEEYRIGEPALSVQGVPSQYKLKTGEHYDVSYRTNIFGRNYATTITPSKEI